MKRSLWVRIREWLHRASRPGPVVAGIFLFVLSNLANAQNPVTMPLPSGSVSVTPLTTGSYKVEDLCPKGVDCIVGGLKLTITFELLGCLDGLGPVSYSKTVTKDAITFQVSAFNIHNKMSDSVECPNGVGIVTIPMIGEFGDVKVNFLDRVVTADD